MAMTFLRYKKSSNPHKTENVILTILPSVKPVFKGRRLQVSP